MSDFLHNVIAGATPLLLASLGGLFTSLSGNLNIALEGLILTSAFSAGLSYIITGNLFFSIVIAIIATIALSALQSLITVKMKANNFIVGLSINMLSLGATSVVSLRLLNHKGVIFLEGLKVKYYFTQLQENIPFLGNILFGYSLLTYISIVLCIVSYIVIYKTPFGLRLRSVGFDSESLVSINVDKYKIISFLISGFFSSLAGIYLVLSIGSYIPNMSAGKGWIALVVIYLGRQKLIGIFLASLLFSVSDLLSNYAQGIMNVPADFILAIPFIVCFIFLVIYSIISNKRAA